MTPVKIDNGTRLLKINDVSRMLAVHPSTVRKWANEGILPFYKIGPRGDRIFKLKDIATFVEVQ